MNGEMNSLADEVDILLWEYLHLHFLTLTGVHSQLFGFLPLASCKVPSIFNSSLGAGISHATRGRTRPITLLAIGCCAEALGEGHRLIELGDSSDKFQDLFVSVMVHLIRFIAARSGQLVDG